MSTFTESESTVRALPKGARAPLIDLNSPGRLRVCNVIALLNVSRATFYAGLKNDRYPKPDGHDQTIPFWHTSTLLSFLTDS